MASKEVLSAKPESGTEKSLRWLRVANYAGIIIAGTVAFIEPAFIPIAAGLIALDVAQIGLYKAVGNKMKSKRLQAAAAPG